MKYGKVINVVSNDSYRISINFADKICILNAESNCFCTEAFFYSETPFEELIGKTIIDIHEPPTSEEKVFKYTIFLENENNFIFFIELVSNGCHLDITWKEPPIARQYYKNINIIIGLSLSENTTFAKKAFPDSVIYDLSKVHIDKLKFIKNVCFVDECLCDIDKYNQLIKQVGIENIRNTYCFNKSDNDYINKITLNL